MTKERSTTFFRANDWWIGKASTLLTLVYLFSYQLKIPFEKFLWLGAASLVVIIGFVSFGYLTNDWFDQEQDALAGKKNIFQGKSRFTGLCYFLLSFILIFSPWLILPFSTISIALIFIELSLFLVYSVPPIRLKERKYFGPVVDALYAHAVPAYFALYTFQLAADNILPNYFAAVLMLWQFLIGFRNIIIHQMDDAEEDKIAGVQNWTTAFKVSQLKFYINILAVAEVATTAILIAFSFNTEPEVQWVALSLLLFFAAVYVMRQQRLFLWFFPHSNWTNFPNFYYEYFLSAAVLFALINFDKSFWMIAAAHAALFFIPALFMILQMLYGLYQSVSFKGIFLQYFFIPFRRFISFIVNNFLYYLFLIFGVDLIKEKMSAADYIKKKRSKK